MKYLTELNFTSLWTLQPNLPARKRYEKASSSQNWSFNMDLGCFPSPGAMFMQSLSTLVWGLRDTKHASLAIELDSTE